MSYWKNIPGKNYKSLSNYSTVSADKGGGGEFYEFEPAIVLDVILDETHEVFANKQLTKLDHNRSQPTVKGEKPDATDVDYSWVGRVLVRLIETQKQVEKEHLIWACPLDSNISEYPLVNEVVIVVKYLDQLYYTKKLNYSNLVNSNEKFGLELSIGSGGVNTIDGNRELNDINSTYKGPVSQARFKGGYGFEGVVGRYFWINKNIRAVKRYEGDLTFESRFGQSIRFSAYDNRRENDISATDLTDYHAKIVNPHSTVPTGGGNPMIIIRNRQRPILAEGDEYQAHKKLPATKGTVMEKNTGGFIDEDINNDGSTIAITSGLTESNWTTSCYKQLWRVGTEEQSGFSPSKCSVFTYPKLVNDQIVVNTDRLILSSRLSETFHFSKKRYAVVTDAEYTVDAHDQLILNTNTKAVINAPAIYLGEYNVTDEPALLGQTTVNWLYELCNWLLDHTHWYSHSHYDAGAESPSQTQLPVQRQALIALRDKLHTLMSRRVFVTGGGFAPGKDGGKITDGTPPVKINTGTGNGTPGGFKGVNYRSA